MQSLSSPSLTSFAVGFALAFVASAPAVAMQIDDWARLSNVSGSLNHCEWTYADVVDGNTVHGFSSLSRQWTALTTVNAPTLRKHNEHFVVEDGATFHGYSPRAGRFAELQGSSGSATLLSSTAPTWHSVALDGDTVHVYFGYSGEWQSYTFSGLQNVIVGRFVVMIEDSAGVHAVSTTYQTLKSLGVPGATLAILGNPPTTAGMATSPGLVHGFSSHLNRWSSHLFAGSVSITEAPGSSQSGFVLIEDGAALTFFSGFTGTFTTMAVGPNASRFWERNVAVAVEGNTAHAYSCITGSTASMAFSFPPTATVLRGFAVVDDGVTTAAFGARNGQFALAPAGTSLFNATAFVATFGPSGATLPTAVYSAVKDVFRSVPQTTTASVQVDQCDLAVLLTDFGTNELHAWSAYDQAWATLSSGQIDQVTATPSTGPSTGNTIIVQCDTALHAFNPRSGQWRSTQTTMPFGTVRRSASTAIVVEPGFAYGYSNYADEWSMVDLPNGGATASVNWNTGFIVDGDDVVAFAGTDQLATSVDFPETFRASVPGTPMRFDLAGVPNAPAMLGYRLVDGPPGTGGLVRRIATQLSSEGLAEITLPAPQNAVLAGSSLLFLALIRHPSGVHATKSIHVLLN